MSDVANISAKWASDRRNVVLSWDATLGWTLYHVYLDGLLYAVTAATSITIPVDPAALPLVEVLDDAADVPTAVYPARPYLCWLGVDNAVSYRIEERIGTSWIERAIVQAEGRTYFDWLTRTLEDGQEHLFRVVPVDSNGVGGVALELPVMMIRHPDAPDAEYSYDEATRVVTININETTTEGSEDMQLIKSLRSSGTGNVDFDLVNPESYQIKEIRFTLASAKDVSGMQLVRTPATGYSKDTVLWAPPVQQPDNTAVVTNLVARFEQPIYISADTQATLTWTNTDSLAWELEIIIETL